MSKRVQLYVLGGLVLVLVWVGFSFLRQSPQVFAVLANQSAFKPMDVQDPTLRLYNIEALQQGQYGGSGRNIFSYGAAPRVEQGPKVPDNPTPVVPKDPGPPPLTVPFKFYGMVTNPANGRRRAFFTNGEDIWIAEEGQMIDRRFRLLRIGNTTAEVEEVASTRRATLPLEEEAKQP